MYIKPVTSVADLLFKAKTEEIYRRLLITGVREYIYKGRNAETFEEACEALNGYVTSPFITDCSNIIKDINRCISDVERQMELEDMKVEVVKNRESKPNQNNDVYINASNTPMTMREATAEEYSSNYETLTRYAQHPLNGETMTFTRVIPVNSTPEYREFAERELERSSHRRIDQIRLTHQIRQQYTATQRRQSRDLWATWYQGNSNPF